MKNQLVKNYKSNFTLREIQKAQVYFDHFFINNLKQTINFIEVRSPLISKHNINTDIFELKNSRGINFDSSENLGVFYQYNRFGYWLINAVNTFEVKNNNSILTKTRFINRDNLTTNHSSMEENKIFIEYRFDNREYLETKIIEIAKSIFKTIIQTRKNIENNFDQLKENFNENLKVINMRKNFRDYKNFNFDDVQIDITQKYGNTLLINVQNDEQKTIDSNSVVFLKLITFSEISKLPFELFRIKVRKSLSELKKISVTSENELEEYQSFDKFVNENSPSTFSIEIDVDNILLFILNLGHKLELQSTIYDDEVEKLFIQQKINHL